jgi:hypothetical protein
MITGLVIVVVGLVISNALLQIVIHKMKKEQLTKRDIEILIQDSYCITRLREKIKEIDFTSKPYRDTVNRIDKEHEEVKKILLDLEMGKQKPKFKKGDKVYYEYSVGWFGSPNETKYRGTPPTYKDFGEYVCRELDYKEGCWMAKVLIDCEVKKIKESELKKVKNEK